MVDGARKMGHIGRACDTGDPSCGGWMNNGERAPTWGVPVEQTALPAPLFITATCRGAPLRGFSVSAGRSVRDSLWRGSPTIGAPQRPTPRQSVAPKPGSDPPPVNLDPWRGVIPAGHRRRKRRSDGEVRGGTPSTRQCLSAQAGQVLATGKGAELWATNREEMKI